MSGGLPFWIMVLDCWSISVQLTTWTSSVVPVFFLYSAANLSQKALVLLAEYSAATSLIDFAAPPLLSASLLEAPVPPPQAASETAADPAQTRTTTRFSRAILSSLAVVGDVAGRNMFVRFTIKCWEASRGFAVICQVLRGLAPPVATAR